MNSQLRQGPRKVQMHENDVSERVVWGTERRRLCQPRHLLCAKDGYHLYAYGDVFAPDGSYLGHIGLLDDHEGLPFVLPALWGGFVKYWHGGDDLDRWADFGSTVVSLDHT